MFEHLSFMMYVVCIVPLLLQSPVNNRRYFAQGFGSKGHIFTKDSKNAQAKPMPVKPSYQQQMKRHRENARDRDEK